MTLYEMVEKLAEKMNVTLEEAKVALEAAEWNMLDAALVLEKEHGTTAQTESDQSCRKDGMRKIRDLIARGMPMSILKEDTIFERIIAIKYDVPNDHPELFEQYNKDIDTFYDQVLEKNG